MLSWLSSAPTRTATSSTRSARWKPGKMCWSKNRSLRQLRRRKSCLHWRKAKGWSLRRIRIVALIPASWQRKKRLKAASWERLSKWKAILTITAGGRNQTRAAAGWRVLWPWCAYDGPDYFSVRSPDHVAYDIRSLRNKANPDDTFEAQLFYGDLKAIVKTSHLVKIDYPKFIVHGKKGSFIKYGIDQQETSLKANIMRANQDSQRMIRSVCWSMSMTRAWR